MLAALLIALIAACLCQQGCGGSRWSDGRFHDDEASYRLGAIGAGWQSVAVDDDNDVAWLHDGWGAVIQVNASCNPELDIPLVALTNHLLIGFTERELREQRLISMDSREALRSHLVAKLDGVERELALTVLKKDGCVYDFAVIASPGDSFARARDSYEQLLRGFATGTAGRQ